MREKITVLGPSPRIYSPKVKIARSILYLSPSIIYPLFRASPAFEHGGKRELAAFRAAWLLWLDASPKAFVSYVDAYHAFVEDLRTGVF